jgi:hypothetical protein
LYRKITLYGKVCQLVAAGWLFSPGILVSSTNTTGRHDITELLLKVMLAPYLIPPLFYHLPTRCCKHPPFIDGIHLYSFVLHVFFQNLIQIRYRKHWSRVLKLLIVLIIICQYIDHDWNLLNNSELVRRIINKLQLAAWYCLCFTIIQILMPITFSEFAIMLVFPCHYICCFSHSAIMEYQYIFHLITLYIKILC